MTLLEKLDEIRKRANEKVLVVEYWQRDAKSVIYLQHSVQDMATLYEDVDQLERALRVAVARLSDIRNAETVTNATEYSKHTLLEINQIMGVQS